MTGSTPPRFGVATAPPILAVVRELVDGVDLGVLDPIDAATLARAAAEVDGAREQVPGTFVSWVDDLGLRHFESPALAFRRAVFAVAGDDAIRAALAAVEGRDHASAALAATVDPDGVLPIATWDAEAAYLARRGDAAALASLLSCLVDDVGSWTDALAVAHLLREDLEGQSLDRIERAFNSTHGTLALSRAGNLLALAGDPGCLDLFATVARVGPDDAERALGLFRIAVAHVKRLGSSPEVVDDAFQAVRAASAAMVDADDRTAVDALLHNLRALVLLQRGDLDGSRREVDLAWQQVSTDGLAPAGFGPMFVMRVRTQVLSNVALVHVEDTGWDGAVDLYRASLALATSDDGEAMRLEAASLLGYALLRSGELEEARDVLLHADEVGAATSSITQRAQLWKLLAVVESDLGNEPAAHAWVAQVEAVEAELYAVETLGLHVRRRDS